MIKLKIKKLIYSAKAKISLKLWLEHIKIKELKKLKKPTEKTHDGQREETPFGQGRKPTCWPIQHWANRGISLMTITSWGQQKYSISWPFQHWANHGNIPVGQQGKNTVGPTAEFHLLTIPTLGQQRKCSSGPTEETHCWANSRIPTVDYSDIGPTE